MGYYAYIDNKKETNMKHILLATVIALLPAVAPAGELSQEGTIITLSETAREKVAQDRVTASFRTEVFAKTPEMAQQKVNQEMKNAVTYVKGFKVLRIHR